jgi:c-di-GMP-binding flagellar brake protein YcgR
MREHNSRSKRQALRFSVKEHSLRFKTEFEEGSGFFENISGGGCAVRSTTVPLTLWEKVLLLLPLEHDEEYIEIGAKVVRIEGDIVAFQFVYLSEDDKQKIVKFFAGKQRSSVS